MTLEKRLKRFYPKLPIMILFYLRRIYNKKKFVYPNDLINALQKPKSSISQALAILHEYDLIKKKYNIFSNNMEPYLKISITKKGLSHVDDILIEILNEREILRINHYK